MLIYHQDEGSRHVVHVQRRQAEPRLVVVLHQVQGIQVATYLLFYYAALLQPFIWNKSFSKSFIALPFFYRRVI